MVSKRRVVDHIVGELAARGVEYVFGVDGANIEDLFDALHFRDGITGVLAKHEFSAATMADGFSRASSDLGVVAATSGGGSLNLLAGLGESYTSRVPVLALVGQPPIEMDGHGSFQDTSGLGGSLDAVAVFSAVSVYCRRVIDPADVVTLLPEAIDAARAGGPAVLLLPKNVQQSMIDVADTGEVVARTPGRATSTASSTNCAARSDRSPSSPATRSPATTRAPNSKNCGRRCARGWRRCPTRRTSAVRPGSAPRRRSASPASWDIRGSRRRSRAARCACWSAPGCLPRHGPDSTTRWAGCGWCRSDRPRRTYPSLHVHSEDLRASLPELVRALTGPGPPTRPSGAGTVAAPRVTAARARRSRHCVTATR